jgi:hypothetical protein
MINAIAHPVNATFPIWVSWDSASDKMDISEREKEKQNWQRTPRQTTKSLREPK